MTAVVSTTAGVETDPSIGAIVLCGSERAFAAGAGLLEMINLDCTAASEADLFGGWDDLTRIRKPLVAAVRGFALGGGCELSMLCDIIVAGPSSSFGQPEIQLG